MSEGQRSTLLAYLRRLGAAARDRGDAELLEGFVAQRDEAAFAALLQRHGPLVWSVCRRVLSEEHAAEDAFQATFLVLVRKARSVSKQASIRSWLHGVALRVALRARQQEKLRHLREQQTPVRPNRDADAEAVWPDVRPILDEEIQRLPEKYRLPVILCYLEGQTNEEAARLLSCPRGTIAVRLARARERLRSRLLRRGVTLSAGTLAVLLADNAMSAAVPPVLAQQTVRAVLLGTASGSITTLTEGVLHTMFLNKLKMAAAFVLILAVLGGAGAGAYYLRAQTLPRPTEVPQNKPEAKKDAQKEKTPEAPKDRKPADGKARLKAQVALAEQAYRGELEAFRQTRRLGNFIMPINQNPETAYAWSVRWLQGERDLSSKHEDQIAALEAHLKRMKELHETLQDLGKDFMPRYRVAEAEWYRLEAETWLAKAKQAKDK